MSDKIIEEKPLEYVCLKDDPRKTPLNQCMSMGDLMATIQVCKELDKKDEELNKDEELRKEKI
jgi:hypothetical protein